MKTLRKIGFFTAFILPGLVMIGFYAGGGWNFLALAFVFGFITVIDHFTGIDKENIEETEAKVVGDEFYYRFVTYIWTFVQVAFVVWGAFAVTTGRLTTTLEWVGFVIGFSLVTGGIGITVAHELGHKKSKLEQFYSKLILMTVCYMHFFIEHNRGHHVQVATPDDPATSRHNESFYVFWFRSVFHGYAHAWQLEKESLHRKGFSTWSVKNEMIWFALLPILFCIALTIIGTILTGRIVWEIPVFFFTQSFFAFTLLELVNYIEHYGIVRNQSVEGKYERVNPLHSWNASHLVSNFFLFQLQRHSDHHANAIKRYQVLNHYDDSPQLPFGYPTMILIALLPPLWFAKMNPRLQEWKEKVYLPQSAA
ncbi:MAG: alkane 1-monooxygenase [Flammeovirgaceae bacterium]|jgi:alkane 1-monooxygenase|nr:alkane 1-monooxygenase [Flammeovirgaceae bacterium]